MKITRTLFHLAVLCDSLRCGAYGSFCYGMFGDVQEEVSEGCSPGSIKGAEHR